MDELIRNRREEDPAMAVTLSESTLARLPAAVARPGYDRARLRPGIVHVGIGNFHRAHQAVYLDDLFAQGTDHDWAIIGAGVRPEDAAMRERLLAQDGLSTVVELAPEGHRARVIGAMIDFLPVEEGHAPLIERMSEPDIRIVSLTVTEGGYYLDGDGGFDAAHPHMRNDADPAQPPKSVFGAMLAALAARRAAGVAPFTIMSCDNLPSNGHVTRATLMSLARLRDPKLADWLADRLACPSSMVDRITPATTSAVRDRVERDFGLRDAAPVICEPFRQWVVEDDFPTGRPALDTVGVTLTDQVEAFEAMKIRVLNGGHAIIAYPAALIGHSLVSDAMADPLVHRFLDRTERNEVLPFVREVPGTDPVDYLALVAQRFSNPDVGDTIARLCLDGSNRQPKFILPSIQDNLRAGRVPEGLCLLSALWSRYCHGTAEDGTPIPPNDPNWAALTRRAEEARHRPAAWLEMREVYGNLAASAAFADRFDHYLRDIWAQGATPVLQRFLHADGQD